MRPTRVFRFGGARRFQANLDVYNALNGSSILNENTNYGPNWKRPTLILDGRLVKVVAWYDNEWGYSNRCVELAAKVLEPKPAAVGTS